MQILFGEKKKKILLCIRKIPYKYFFKVNEISERLYNAAKWIRKRGIMTGKQQIHVAESDLKISLITGINRHRLQNNDDYYI